MVSHNMTSLDSPVEERELERQLHLTRLLLEEMGGCLPHEQILAHQLTSVLDVACGAGGWVLDIAESYPSLHVTGIDNNAFCVAYAQRLADEKGLVNARFHMQNICTLEDGPWKPDSFDLINVAFIASTLLTTDYAALMQSLFRLCRPGGMVRWTEMEFPLTNSLAFEQFMELVCRVLDVAGQTFVPPDMQRTSAIFDDWRRSLGQEVTPFERRTLGITPMMGGWLRKAGCWEVESFPVPIEVSMGTKAHAAFVQQVAVFGQQIAPFLCEQGVIAAEDLAYLLMRVQDEIQQEDFCGLCLFLTVSGYKAA